jgi:outer membrane biosynthesis protein TonB
MQGGFAFSIGVHALILLLVIFGLPFLRPKPIALPPMISVEVVDMGKETTTNKISPVNKVRKIVEDEPPPPPTPPPQTQPQPPAQAETEPPPPPPPAQPTPRPALDAAIPKLAPVDDALPDLKVPDETIKPRLAPAPELAQVDAAMADLKVPPKVELKRPPPKKPVESMDAVLKNIEKLKPQEQSPPQPAQPVKLATKPPSGAQAPLSATLTASELSALSAQLGRCINWPAGAKNAQDLIVELDVTVNPDRTVASAEIVDQGRMSSDPVFRVAAQAAVRGLRMPQCIPLDLPPDKYQEWQSLRLRIDPREMLG